MILEVNKKLFFTSIKMLLFEWNSYFSLSKSIGFLFKV